MTTATIPVIISDEIRAQVAAAGMERELEVMLDWVRKTAPDLQGIHVGPGSPYSRLTRDLVVITAHRKWDDERPPTDLVEWDWICWKVQNFPPAVCCRLIMSCSFQPLPTPERVVSLPG
jgi:hypothetical protein